MKRIAATILVVLSVGAAGSAALAAGASNDRAVLPTATETSPEQAATDDPAGETDGTKRHCGRGEARRHRLRRAAVRTAAEAMGISVSELRDAVREHGSIAAAAEANGVDPATVEAALLARVEVRVAEAVERGRIDDERAAQILEHAGPRIHRFVTAKRDAKGDGAHEGTN